jgi:hypothetical protein
MFVPGQTVMESGSANFVTPREAMASPLAKKLFTIEGNGRRPKGVETHLWRLLSTRR